MRYCQATRPRVVWWDAEPAQYGEGKSGGFWIWHMRTACGRASGMGPGDGRVGAAGVAGKCVGLEVLREIVCGLEGCRVKGNRIRLKGQQVGKRNRFSTRRG